MNLQFSYSMFDDNTEASQKDAGDVSGLMAGLFKMEKMMDICSVVDTTIVWNLTQMLFYQMTPFDFGFR